MLQDTQTSANFFRLQSQARYEAVIQACQQRQSIWLLQDEQGCLLVELGKERILPIWPQSSLAEEWRLSEHASFVATQISYNDLVDKWLPGLDRDGIKLGVAPNLAGESMVVDAIEFAAEIGLDLTLAE